MRAAVIYTAVCSAIALASAGAIPFVVTPLGRLILAVQAVALTAGARGGMYAIEVATRPPTTFSNHHYERRAQ